MKDDFGIAFDIGTSTVCASLVNLSSHSIVATSCVPNGQRDYGDDIITRMEFALFSHSNLLILQQRILKNIEDLIFILLDKREISKSQIKALSFSGNTVMYHFLLAEDIKTLAVLPHRSDLKIKGKKLQDFNFSISSILPSTEIIFLPIISGFLGGDVSSMIIITKIYKSKNVKLLIDLGTNGELVLGNRNFLLATSVACGPAFEGYNISSGTIAQRGAIYKIKFDKDIQYKTIENIQPIGICASGIIDLIAEMLKHRIINKQGKIVDNINKISHPFRERIRDSSFTVFEKGLFKIVLTQNDIRNIQLAKSAVKSGCNVLLNLQKIHPDDIEQILIAGAFGNYANPKNLTYIGLLPKINIDKIQFIGNSSLRGAEAVLMDRSLLYKTEKIIDSVKRIQLSGNKKFENEFIKNLSFS